MSKDIAESISFWTLINKPINGDKLKIRVPDLQRDYAEGRLDKETTQIRTHLIRQLCVALENQDEKTLNFIYGTLEKNEFIPIDGQQRLTTLFLLHWYVFAKSDNYKNCITELSRFTYQSRTTTDDFCYGLCNIRSISNDGQLSVWLKNRSWFSGNISLDPSVKSMLVVLDAIEYELEGADFNQCAAYLTNPSCKIGFLWFDVGNFNSEDLYIKMNSRGKHLTEFESFKAKLQPSESRPTILNDVFSSTEEAIEFIGRINNQYTNLFYKSCGPEDFDNAMMFFFISLIKCDQFAYVTSLQAPGLNTKVYRDIFSSADMGGVFYDKFINAPVQQWRERNTDRNGNAYDIVDEAVLKSKIVHSLRKVDYVLSALPSIAATLDATPITQRAFANYAIDALIRSNITHLQKEQLRQYAILEYLYCMKPENEKDFTDFELWKRFVANALENAEDSKGDNGFSDTAETFEAINFFSGLINHIFQNRDEHIYDAIIEACDAYLLVSKSRYPNSIHFQAQEEYNKLKLMQSDDQWFALILEAERYFCDGQIAFLLNTYDGTKDDFRRILEMAKKLFTQEKSINTDVLWYKLQRAALCCPDNTADKTAYLNQATNWRFHIPGVSYKPMLAHGDLQKIVTACKNATDLHSALDSIPAPLAYIEDEYWKTWFAGNMLEKMVAYNLSADRSYNFSFAIAFRSNAVLLLTGKRTSAPSMEMETFRLFCELSDIADKSLHFGSSDRIVNEENVPLRYVVVGNKKIGYDSTINTFVDIDNPSAHFTFDAAREYLATP